MRLRLPYNKANYKELVDKNYLYVDKTKYIEMLEDDLDITDGLFLRPRRFGKSLFLSTLYYYYDINQKSEFNHLFKGTYIGNNPTKEVNSFYILRFNFSVIDASNKTKLLDNFNVHVRDMIVDFKAKYNLDISFEITDSPGGTLSSFLTALKNITGKKLIILIDEYDHFTNDILNDKDFFNDITGADGFVRSFYTTMKANREDGCLAKVILTGVSAILLDSLTSGANNITNYSMHHRFNELFGFTEAEIVNMMKKLDESNVLAIPNKDVILNDLEYKYNGYLFSKLGVGNRVFNSNLVNWYLSEYIENGRPPRTTKGTNILSDDKKIVAMLDLYHNVENRERIITQIITTGEIEASYIDSFELGKQLDEEQFKHLLYYLGVLTIGSATDDGNFILKVPNKVTEDIFYDTLKRYLKRQYQLDNISDKTRNAVKNFIDTRDLTELNKVLESEFSNIPKEGFSGFNENTLQVAYYLAFNEYKDIEVKLEETINGGRADLIIRHDNSKAIMEFKYLSNSKYNEAEFETKKLEGIKQLNQYVDGYDGKVDGYLVFFVGSECKLCEIVVSK